MIGLLQTVIEIWIDGFKKTFDYRTRANRFEFNTFMFVYAVFAAIALFVLVQIGYGAMSKSAQSTIKVILSIIMCILYLPAISITVRRARDAGAPPWVGLLYFVPIVGWAYIGTIVAKPSIDN